MFDFWGTTYLLLICINMECLCFKLQFGHLIPETDTHGGRKNKGDRGREEMKKERAQSRKKTSKEKVNKGHGTETEMD